MLKNSAVRKCLDNQSIGICLHFSAVGVFLSVEMRIKKFDFAQKES